MVAKTEQTVCFDFRVNVSSGRDSRQLVDAQALIRQAAEDVGGKRRLLDADGKEGDERFIARRMVFDVPQEESARLHCEVRRRMQEIRGLDGKPAVLSIDYGPGYCISVNLPSAVPG